MQWLPNFNSSRSSPTRDLASRKNLVGSSPSLPPRSFNCSGRELFTAPAGVVAYVLVVLRYRKRAATAEDRYFRAERLGKYASTSTND